MAGVTGVPARSNFNRLALQTFLSAHTDLQGFSAHLQTFAEQIKSSPSDFDDASSKSAKCKSRRKPTLVAEINNDPFENSRQNVHELEDAFYSHVEELDFP